METGCGDRLWRQVVETGCGRHVDNRLWRQVDSSGGGVDVASLRKRGVAHAHCVGAGTRAQGGGAWPATACRVAGDAPPECGGTARTAPAAPHCVLPSACRMYVVRVACGRS